MRREGRSRSPVLRRAGGARPTAPVVPPVAAARAPYVPPPHVMAILDDIMSQLRSLRADAAATRAIADDLEVRVSRIEGILAAVTVAWSTGGAETPVTWD